VHVYPDSDYKRILDVIDAGSKYGLTGAVIADDRGAVLAAQQRLRHTAGNFYVNDKPTGAVVGQQPFGGSRASGTNDKAGVTAEPAALDVGAVDQGDLRAAHRPQLCPHGGLTMGVFQQVVRPVILGAAQSSRMRRAAEQIPVTRKVVDRFVAGETVPEAVDAVAQLRDSGRTVTIDYLGEDTTKVEDADATVRAYLDLLDALGKRGEAANSKVRAAGGIAQAVGSWYKALPRDGEKIALENAHTICERAKGIGAWVSVDAEDHTTTDSTLSIVRELRTEFDWLGTVLQSYLKRTPADCEEFAASGARIRLCKGAYDEPASVAYRDMDDVNRLLPALPRRADGRIGLSDGGLTRSGNHRGGTGAGPARPAAASPISSIRCCTASVTPSNDGWPTKANQMRVYVPFGNEWYGYFSCAGWPNDRPT